MKGAEMCMCMATHAVTASKGAAHLDAGHRHVDRVGQCKHARTLVSVARHLKISVREFVWATTVELVLGPTADAREILLDLCVDHTLSHDGNVVCCDAPDEPPGRVAVDATSVCNGIELRDPMRPVCAPAKGGGDVDVERGVGLHENSARVEDAPGQDDAATTTRCARAVDGPLNGRG